MADPFLSAFSIEVWVERGAAVEAPGTGATVVALDAGGIALTPGAGAAVEAPGTAWCC